MTAADQCHAVLSHVVCLQDSRQDSAEPVNIMSQCEKTSHLQPSSWLPLTCAFAVQGIGNVYR